MITLVTGASGSGKSAFAEQLVLQSGNENRYYIATMQPWDEECRARILRHQKMREKKKFKTLEQYGCMSGLSFPGEKNTVLLECLSNYAANLCFNSGRTWTAEELEEDVIHLAAQADSVIIVTNEVFSDGCLYDDETRSYLRTLGGLNVRLAKRADRVAEVIFGIDIWHKGGR